ncbi:MAG: hypothetical protein ACYTGN_12120 [Planctomycetota bacterium]|jgi:uncharacterized membrane protein
MSERTKAVEERERRQLRRLEVLIDVVFGLAILRIVSNLPSVPPGITDLEAARKAFSDRGNELEVVIVGIAMLVIYWIQNNGLYGCLKRTDNRHTTLSILQVVFLLVFLYASRLGVVLQASTPTLLLQSGAAAAMGFTASYSWAYAMKDRRLLTEELTDEEAGRIRAGTLTEPVSALFTIPFAFAGSGWWTLSWLIYPVARWAFPKLGALN